MKQPARKRLHDAIDALEEIVCSRATHPAAELIDALLSTLRPYVDNDECSSFGLDRPSSACDCRWCDVKRAMNAAEVWVRGKGGTRCP